MPLSASGPSLRNGGVSQVSGNCYEWFTYGLSGRPAFLTTARACPAGPLDRVRQAFVDVSVMSYAPDGEATERFVRYSDYGRANDVLLLQLYTSVHLPDGEVRRLLGLFDAGGFWSDIDYDDRTRGRWQPSLHLTRMYALAKLYADPASAWHGDGRIGGLLHKGLAYWYAKKPSSLNWWHGEIGVPKKLAAILLMIRGELSGPELEQGLRIIERSRFGRTGQNKVWLAGNNLMRGLLTDDEALVAEARDQIAEEIVVTDGEGIQDDWSFHQHGPQIQFGNYGLAYAEGLSFWLRVLDGTPYMFSDAQCAVIEKLMREGICRSIWRGVMDPSFCGRQVFIDSGPGKASSAAVAAENIAALKRPGYRVSGGSPRGYWSRRTAQTDCVGRVITTVRTAASTVPPHGMRRSACTPTVRSASSLRTGRTLWPTSRPTGRCCSCSTGGSTTISSPIGTGGWFPGRRLTTTARP